jgi:DNA-binding beta-propeller fold protein YncE
MAPRGRSLSLVAFAAVALVLSVAGAAVALGELSQRPGVAACLGGLPEEGCGEARLLTTAEGLAVSPDGMNVYVAAAGSDALLVFDRDPATRALAQKPGAAGCISKAGAGCAQGIAFGSIDDVVVSPDGRNVYVTINDGVAIFDRGPEGVLTQKSGADACISRFPDGGCRLGRGFSGEGSIAISPDGGSVYVGSLHGFAILDRDPEGRLTQKPGAAGCVTQEGNDGAGQPCLVGRGTEFVRDVTVSPDGRSVYAVTFGSDSIAIFDRQPDGSVSQKPGEAGCLRAVVAEGCGRGRRVEEGQGVTVSPDGRNVYVAASQDLDVAIFDRGPDGSLAQKPGLDGCISSFPLATDCRQVRSLGGAGIGISPDGGQVYVAGRGEDGVTVFDRDTAGGLVQKPGTAGCISGRDVEGCGRGRGIPDPIGVALSADGRSLYVLSRQDPGALAVFDRAMPSPPPDTLAPQVSGFRLAPARFRVRPKRGSSFRFALSEQASVLVEVERALPGRRAGKRCKEPSRRLAKRAACKRFARVARLGLGTRSPGENAIPFSGRVGKRALKPGAYRATIAATDAAGNRSVPSRAAFTILPAARR